MKVPVYNWKYFQNSRNRDSENSENSCIHSGRLISFSSLNITFFPQRRFHLKWSPDPPLQIGDLSVCWTQMCFSSSSLRNLQYGPLVRWFTSSFICQLLYFRRKKSIVTFSLCPVSFFLQSQSHRRTAINLFGNFATWNTLKWWNWRSKNFFDYQISLTGLIAKALCFLMKYIYICTSIYVYLYMYIHAYVGKNNFLRWVQ